MWKITANTAENTLISPDFLETMRKLCLSTKFPHKEMRWNYGIFHSETQLSQQKTDWSESVTDFKYISEGIDNLTLYVPTPENGQTHS